MKIRYLLIVFFVLIFINGCNIFENESTSGSKLIIQSIEGTEGDGDIIFSDVFIAGGGSGSSEQDGSIENDNAYVKVIAILLDPSCTCPEESSFYNDIIVNQIKVEYSRSDGRNVEGVDVPLSFTQTLHVRVAVQESVISIPFIIVRHVAKLEPPLRDLREYGQEKILQLNAKITVYGKDGGGHDVEPVSGMISVWCSDFPD